MGMRGLMVLAGAAIVVFVVNFYLGSSLQGYAGFGRSTAWFLTMGVFIAMMGYVGFMVKGRADGIFIDDRNRISLSRFQLVLWTVLLVSALLTTGLSNAFMDDPTPLMIVVPPQVWALLGIGAFSFVTAPALVESRKKDDKPDDALAGKVEATVRKEDVLDPAKKVDIETNVPAKEDAQEARWMDLIRGDTAAGYAQIDVSKVQQLAFTILLVMIYGAALQAELSKVATTLAGMEIKGFPPIDGGFVALLGLSHAAYLTYKKTAP